MYSLITKLRGNRNRYRLTPSMLNYQLTVVRSSMIQNNSIQFNIKFSIEKLLEKAKDHKNE